MIVCVCFIIVYFSRILRMRRTTFIINLGYGVISGIENCAKFQ